MEWLSKNIWKVNQDSNIKKPDLGNRFNEINRKILLSMEAWEKFVLYEDMANNEKTKNLADYLWKTVTVDRIDEKDWFVDIREIWTMRIDSITDIPTILEKVDYKNFYNELNTWSSFNYDNKTYTVLTKSNLDMKINAVNYNKKDNMYLSIADFKDITDIKIMSEEDIRASEDKIRSAFGFLPNDGDSIMYRDNNVEVWGIILWLSSKYSSNDPHFLVNAWDVIEEISYKDIMSVDWTKIEEYKSNPRTASNFHLRITRQETEELLKNPEKYNVGCYFDIMCKEYWDDDDWVGINDDDLNEEGSMDSDYKTFEIFFDPNIKDLTDIKSALTSKLDEYSVNAMENHVSELMDSFFNEEINDKELIFDYLTHLIENDKFSRNDIVLIWDAERSSFDVTLSEFRIWNNEYYLNIEYIEWLNETQDREKIKAELEGIKSKIEKEIKNVENNVTVLDS